MNESMMEGLKIFAGILGMVLVIGVAIAGVVKFTGKGKEQIDSIDKITGGMEASEFTMMDGGSQSGTQVVDTIKQYHDNVDVEIVVSTKDGVNLCYHKDATPILDTTLTGVPENGATLPWTQPVAASATKGKSGYKPDLPVATKGYINESAFFKSSIQKNASGLVQRVTFVQQ